MVVPHASDLIFPLTPAVRRRATIGQTCRSFDHLHVDFGNDLGGGAYPPLVGVAELREWTVSSVSPGTIAQDSILALTVHSSWSVRRFLTDVAAIRFAVACWRRIGFAAHPWEFLRGEVQDVCR